MNELQIQIFEHVLNHDAKFRDKLKAEIGLEIAKLASSLNGLNSLIASHEEKSKPIIISKEKANKISSKPQLRKKRALSHSEAIKRFLKTKGNEGAVAKEIVSGLAAKKHNINQNSIGWYMQKFRNTNSIKQTKEGSLGLRYFWIGD